MGPLRLSMVPSAASRTMIGLAGGSNTAENDRSCKAYAIAVAKATSANITAMRTAPATFPSARAANSLQFLNQSERPSLVL